MSHEDQLWELLSKQAEDPKLEDNEDASTAVGNNNVYEDPEGREGPGKSTSPWGEAGPQDHGRNAPAVFTSAATEASVDGKQGVMGRLLSSKPSADSVDQAIMAANLEHVSSGDFETHSLLLQGKAKEKIAMPRAQTLMQQVLDKTGRV